MLHHTYVQPGLSWSHAEPPPHFNSVFNQNSSAVSYTLIMDAGKQRQAESELSAKVIMHMQIDSASVIYSVARLWHGQREKMKIWTDTADVCLWPTDLRAAVLPLSRSDAPENDSTPTHRPLRKKTSGSHLWRLSNPPSKASPLMDRATSLQRTYSAQNLTSDGAFQHLLVDLFLNICCHFCWIRPDYQVNMQKSGVTWWIYLYFLKISHNNLRSCLLFSSSSLTCAL